MTSTNTFAQRSEIECSVTYTEGMVRIFTIFRANYARIMLSCRTGITRLSCAPQLPRVCRCLLQKRRKEMTPVLQARIMQVLLLIHDMVHYQNG